MLVALLVPGRMPRKPTESLNSARPGLLSRLPPQPAKSPEGRCQEAIAVPACRGARARLRPPCQSDWSWTQDSAPVRLMRSPSISPSQPSCSASAMRSTRLSRISTRSRGTFWSRPRRRRAARARGGHLPQGPAMEVAVVTTLGAWSASSGGAAQEPSAPIRPPDCAAARLRRLTATSPGVTADNQRLRAVATRDTLPGATLYRSEAAVSGDHGSCDEAGAW